MSRDRWIYLVLIWSGKGIKIRNSITKFWYVGVHDLMGSSSFGLDTIMLKRPRLILARTDLGEGGVNVTKFGLDTCTLTFNQKIQVWFPESCKQGQIYFERSIHFIWVIFGSKLFTTSSTLIRIPNHAQLVKKNQNHSKFLKIFVSCA